MNRLNERSDALASPSHRRLSARRAVVGHEKFPTGKRGMAERPNARRSALAGYVVLVHVREEWLRRLLGLTARADEVVAAWPTEEATPRPPQRHSTRRVLPAATRARS